MTTTNLHPVLARQVAESLTLGLDMDVDIDGTALVWRRNGWELSWSGERQPLPRGSSPLQVMGGPAIEGQGWTGSEVESYHRITRAAVIYEREA